MVVATLVEQSLPTPEVRGSNPVIDKFYIYYLSTVLKRRKLIKKRPRMAHLNEKCFEVGHRFRNGIGGWQSGYFLLLDLQLKSIQELISLIDVKPIL